MGASKTGAALQGLTFDAFYSSPLKRARETAEIIVSQLQIDPAVTLQFTDNLKEINLLAWEGMAFDEVKAQFPEQYRIWRDRPHELQLERVTAEGVTPVFPIVSLFEQAKQFWREVLPRHDGETILAVAHSAINRALLCTAIGLEPASIKSFHQSNCGISVLNFSGTLGDPVQLESVNLTAHLGVTLPEPREEKGIRFLLVRHGETDWNREKRFQGQIDVPLNAAGRQQSQQAANFLQDIPIDRAVSSPMLRPKETAEIILQPHPQVTLELYDDLKEIAHGLWEGKLEAEIETEYATELEQWKRSPASVQMPQGENLEQVWERSIAAWQAMLATVPSDAERLFTILVVAHDAVNKALLCHLSGLPPAAFWTFKQGNGSVTVIDYPGGAGSKPLIQALNITSHLSDGVLDRTAAGAL